MHKGRAGKVKVTCPDCKEKSAGKLKYNAENNRSIEHYFCKICRNHWDMTEVLVEEFKTARFRGQDGEWKFLQHTEARKDDLRANTNMWKNNKRSRDSKGKFAGGMNKKDVNMLKRLRRK
jgi:hypothetical protein